MGSSPSNESKTKPKQSEGSRDNQGQPHITKNNAKNEDGNEKNNDEDTTIHEHNTGLREKKGLKKQDENTKKQLQELGNKIQFFNLQLTKRVQYNMLENARQRLAELQKSTRAERANVKDVNANVLEERTLQKREKSKLIFKLSEMASQRLRANNSAITDLSDPNRATKISERFSELYDNEWTDVFEWLTNTNKLNERNAVGLLRDIFEMCCDVCKNVAASQRLHFLGYLKLLPNVTSDAIENCSPALLHRLQEFQKLTSHRTIGNLRKIIINRIGKEDAKKTTEEFQYLKKKHCVPFVNKAIDVCWHSHIQSPPLAFIFEPSSEFAGTHFKPYTASGTELDYVVWPALLLHEGGSILFKGIAQFKNKSETTQSETNQVTTVDDQTLEEGSKTQNHNSSDSTW